MQNHIVRFLLIMAFSFCGQLNAKECKTEAYNKSFTYYDAKMLLEVLKAERGECAALTTMLTLGSSAFSILVNLYIGPPWLLAGASLGATHYILDKGYFQPCAMERIQISKALGILKTSNKLDDSALSKEDFLKLADCILLAPTITIYPNVIRRSLQKLSPDQIKTLASRDAARFEELAQTFSLPAAQN